MSALGVRLGRTLRPYVAFARIGFRERLTEGATLLTRSAFLGLVMLIYTRLWRALLPAHAGAGPGATEYVWYVGITEWIALSQPWLHLEIDRDVRSGEIVCQLTRPISYVAGKLAEASGELALNLIALGVSAVGFAYALTGTLPRDARGLLLALPLGVLASVLAVFCRALIGLTAFWLVDSSPVNWVWQKLTFLLGGLFVPLALYPNWLRAIALASPFSTLLYGPGSMAFGFDPAEAARVGVKLLAWGALLVALLASTYRRGLRVLDAHGG